jgi:hypothetical protein
MAKDWVIIPISDDIMEDGKYAQLIDFNHNWDMTASNFVMEGGVVVLYDMVDTDSHLRVRVGSGAASGFETIAGEVSVFLSLVSSFDLVFDFIVYRDVFLARGFASLHIDCDATTLPGGAIYLYGELRPCDATEMAQVTFPNNSLVEIGGKVHSYPVQKKNQLVTVVVEPL